MSMQRLTCILVMVAAMAMAGCGGGGAMSPMDEIGGGTGGGFTLGIGSMPDPSMMGGIPATARNSPLAGDSVTQSSIGANRVTTDNIEVNVKYGTDVLASYTVQNGDKWSLRSEDTLAEGKGRLPSGLTVFAVAAVKPGPTDNDPETVLVLLTDIESASDTDYLVWGTWNIAPHVVSAHLPSIYGVFATGGDPFTQGNLPALTGIATYRGDARGYYFEPGNPGQSWNAIAELKADFGSGIGLGTIEGSINQFRFDLLTGEEVASPTTVVTLSPTAIGSANSGFFQGATIGTFDDGTELSGKWGGQFFGNNESDGKPGSVAGTFGAISGDDTRGLIGAFAAPDKRYLHNP